MTKLTVLNTHTMQVEPLEEEQNSQGDEEAIELNLIA